MRRQGTFTRFKHTALLAAIAALSLCSCEHKELCEDHEPHALRNGKVLSFDYDVTDQLLHQPHGGVIRVGGIEISDDDGKGGSGGFDVDVDGWGDYEDIPIDM